MIGASLNKTNLSDPESVVKFVKDIQPLTKLKVISENNEYNGDYLLGKYVEKKGFIFLIKEGKPTIRLKIKDLPKNDFGVTALELYDSTPPIPKTSEQDPSPEKPTPEETSPLEVQSDTTVIEVPIEEEMDVLYKEISEWDKKHSIYSLQDDLIKQLSEYYQEKNKNKTIDSLQNETLTIIDLVKEYQLHQNDPSNKEVVRYGLHYKPLLKNIQQLDFNGTYISPIVYDQKKFYSTNKAFLDQSEDNPPEQDIYLVSQQLERDIKNELNNKFRDKKERDQQYTEYKLMQQTLYNGGSINLPIADSVETEHHFFESINRSYLNRAPDSSINCTYYTGNLKQNTIVYRDCYTKENGCTNNPEIEEDVKISISRRLADGAYIMLEDIYEDIGTSDSKKKIISCSSVGDRYYGLSEIDTGKTISKSPYYNEYVEGEAINIIGFYIKNINSYMSQMLNGKEHVINNGESKIYPKMLNSGTTLYDAIIQEKNPNLTVKVTNNIDEFDWNNYKDNNDNVVLFDINSNESLNSNKFNNMANQILLSVDEIMQIEIKNIEKCSNILELGKILNKHNLYINQLSTSAIVKYRIPRYFIYNITQFYKYEQFITQRYLTNKKHINIFSEIYSALLQFKQKAEYSIGGSIHYIPSSEYYTQLKLSLIEYSKSIFEQYDMDTLDKFSKIFLHIQSEADTLDELQSQIIDNILLISSIFSSSEFHKYFINTDELIHPDYKQLFLEYLKHYDINIPSFNKSYLDYFDVSILKQIKFISSMKKIGNNSKEILQIIDLSNIHTLKNNIKDILHNYAKNTYESSKKESDLDWHQLSEEDQNKYLPNEQTIYKLEDKKKRIRDIYNQQKQQWGQYVSECQNLKIIKEYSSKEALLADNGQSIFVDPQYDTTQQDIDLYKTIVSEYPSDEVDANFQKIMETVYLFETIDDIQYKIERTREILKSPTPGNQRRKVLSGELCVLNENSNKFLYRRQGLDWISINKDTYKNMTKCFRYDTDILKLNFEDIESYCLNLSKENNDRDCIEGDNNKSMVKKLYGLHSLYSYISNQASNLTKIMVYKDGVHAKIQNSVKNLQNRLDTLKKMKSRKNRSLIRENIIEKSNRVYPPSNIREKLGNILKITDFDVMGQQLIEFISTYGKDTGIDEEGYLVSGNYWYYNIPKVNVPMLCKHYEILLTSVLKDNQTKLKALDEVRDKFGKSDGECFYCTNCGEVIGFQKYSEFEGFGKDEKVINIREVVIETIVDEENFTSMISSEKLAIFVNIVLKKVGIDIRVDDYKLIMDIIDNRKSKIEQFSFKQFYNTILLKGTGSIQKIVSKQGYNKLANIFESKGGVYDIQFFKDLNTELLSIEKKLSKFLNLFYNRTESKDGKFIKLYKGFIYNAHISYAIATIAEVVRTAIPDYNIKGSGQEKQVKKGKTSGLLIQDVFQSIIQEDQKPDIYWILAYLRDVIFEDINLKTGNQLQFINLYLTTIHGKSDEQFSTDVVEAYNEIKLMSDIKYRNTDKEEYRLKQFVQKQDESSIVYEWETFLPSLKFNNIYTYTPPNITSIIDKHKELLVRLKSLNINLRDQKEQSILLEMQNDIRKITIELYNTESELTNIENKLTFALIVKINNIITNNKIDTNFNMTAYISSTSYDIIQNDYLDIFISEDPTIKNTVDLLKEIQSYLTKYKLVSNVVYEISNNNHPISDLQNFMKFDESLYNRDQELIKQAYIDKVKQINYIYVQSGPFKGQLRQFKEMFDSDLHLLTDLYVSDDQDEEFSIDINKRLREKLMELYGPTYPHIDFKMNMLLNHNGSALVDMVTLEFKKDISDKIEAEMSSKSIQEIKAIIDDIETKSNIVINNTEQFLIPAVYENNNVDIIDDKLITIVTEFSSICLNSETDTVIENLKKIQARINETLISSNTITPETLMLFQTDISSITIPYFQYCEFEISSKLNEIAKYINIPKLSPAMIITSLQNIADMDNYYDEILIELGKKLKIEGIQDESLIEIEKTYKKNQLDNHKFANQINIHISIIRYALNLISYFYNQIPDTQNPSPIQRQSKLQFLVSEDRDTIRRITENYDNIVRPIIELIMSRQTPKNLFPIPIDKFDKIHALLNKLTFYNNILNVSGNIKQIFVTNPQFLSIITKTLIVYLMNSLLKEFNEDHNMLVSPIITAIYKYIMEVSDVNNITDTNIQTILKKQRADESNNRLKQFQKKDEEEQSLHKLYRSYNLGKHMAKEEDTIEVDAGDIDFMTTEDDQDNIIGEGVVLDEDGEFDGGIVEEQDSLNLISNIMVDDLEDLEERE